jgi:hypothetical protein
LIGWRDFLAHRYLRVRLSPQGADAPQVDPSLAVELLELGQAFSELTGRIRQEMLAVLSAWPVRVKETPHEIQKTLEGLAIDLATLQPQRFSRAGAATPPDDVDRDTRAADG